MQAIRQMCHKAASVKSVMDTALPGGEGELSHEIVQNFVRNCHLPSYWLWQWSILYWSAVLGTWVMFSSSEMMRILEGRCVTVALLENAGRYVLFLMWLLSRPSAMDAKMTCWTCPLYLYAQVKDQVGLSGKRFSNAALLQVARMTHLYVNLSGDQICLELPRCVWHFTRIDR